MYRLVIILIVGLLLLGCDREAKKIYYKDGSYQVIEYKDSLKHGKFKSYYNTGELEIEGTYKNDKQEGPFKWYYKSGTLETEAYFKNDKQEGLTKYYSPEGEIISETEYKDGLVHGDFREYYDKGQLLMYAKYKNDTVIYYEEYDKEGNLIEEFRRISIDPLKDSIKVGERFKAKISIPGPIENRDVKIVPFLIGIDEKSGMYKNKKEVVYTSFPAEKAGEYLFHVNAFIDTSLYKEQLYVKVYEDNGR